MRNILLAVDLQKDFIDGSLAVPKADAILPEIDRIKGQFDLVYFTLDWHPLNHCSFKAQGGPWPPHCVHHTAGASLPDRVLEGLDENRIRFILKGRNPGREEYGAFEGVRASRQSLFMPGDRVTICGIASEYCVLETLKNIWKLSRRIGFDLQVFLPGIAAFSTHAPLQAFMAQARIPSADL